MRVVRVAHLLASSLRLLGVSMLVPVIVALAYEPSDFRVLGVPVARNAVWFGALAAATACLGQAVRMLLAPRLRRDMRDRDLYLAVGLGWPVAALVAALGLYGTGAYPSFVDAFFEAMSGATATGSSVLVFPETAPESVLAWRATLQFLGGFAFLVLLTAVLARVTHGGAQTVLPEAPGMSSSQMRPRLFQTAAVMGRIYVLFAAIVAVFLVVILRRDGAPWSEAALHGTLQATSAISAGGFTSHSGGIGYYGSVAMEVVLIVAMLAAGTSFALHAHLLRGNAGRMLRDADWRWYVILFGSFSLATAILLVAGGRGVGEALRGGSFAVASVLSTTGFANQDYGLWPETARLLLVAGVFVGATAGSTGGGMKLFRVLLLTKVVFREFRKLRHPRAVIPLRHGGRVMKEETLMAAVTFVFAYLTVWLLGFFLLLALEPQLGLVAGGSASASALGNANLALGALSEGDGYLVLKAPSKLLLAALMWIGRVEIFAALVVFHPRSWTR